MHGANKLNTIAKRSGVILNAKKCVFSKREMKFVEHANDTQPSPDKIQAMVDIEPPRDQTGKTVSRRIIVQGLWIGLNTNRPKLFQKLGRNWA